MELPHVPHILCRWKAARTTRKALIPPGTLLAKMLFCLSRFSPSLPSVCFLSCSVDEIRDCIIRWSWFESCSQGKPQHKLFFFFFCLRKRLRWHIRAGKSEVSNTGFLSYICWAQNDIILMIISDDKKVRCVIREMACLQGVKWLLNDCFQTVLVAPAKACLLPVSSVLNWRCRVLTVTTVCDVFSLGSSLKLWKPEKHCFHFPHNIVLVKLIFFYPPHLRVQVENWQSRSL